MLLWSQKEAGPHGPPTLGVVVCRPVLVGQPWGKDLSSLATPRRGLVVMPLHGDTGPGILKGGGCQNICSWLSPYCVSGVKGKVLLPEEEEESTWEGRSE